MSPRKFFVSEPDPVDEAFQAWREKWDARMPDDFVKAIGGSLRKQRDELQAAVKGGASAKGVFYAIVSNVAGDVLEKEYRSMIAPPVAVYPFRTVYDEALQQMLDTGHAEADFIESQRSFMANLRARQLGR